jgi:hypothetical protein
LLLKDFLVKSDVLELLFQIPLTAVKRQLLQVVPRLQSELEIESDGTIHSCYNFYLNGTCLDPDLKQNPKGPQRQVTLS